MLHITIFAVGKLKESFWKDAVAEYLKRLDGYAKVEVREVPDSSPEKEAAALLTAFGGKAGGSKAKASANGKGKPGGQGTNKGKVGGPGAGTFDGPLILLDIKGKETSSEQLARKIDAFALEGQSHIGFVIGGSDGVTADVRQCCTERMSFGPITLPHNLARVVLLEQIYRAFKINRGEPYHK